MREDHAKVEKKVGQPTQSPTISKMPTAESIAGTATGNGAEIESRTQPGRWFYGVQVQGHPHTLLLAILDCLREMGYVLFSHSTVEMAI